MDKFVLPEGSSYTRMFEMLVAEVNTLRARIKKLEADGSSSIYDILPSETKCIQRCNADYTGNPHIKGCPKWRAYRP